MIFYSFLLLYFSLSFTKSLIYLEYSFLSKLSGIIFDASIEDFNLFRNLEMVFLLYLLFIVKILFNFSIIGPALMQSKQTLI